MSPTIPSPTPITGVKTAGGRPGVRRPIDVFQKDYPFAFALYVQALAAWQNAGNESDDKNNDIGTSYFQVTGVHGVPYVPWQQDPTPGQVTDAGYCTHRSVLFMPWHRPYMMLYEQIIYAYAESIAGSATGNAAEAYAAALPDVRLPYWDWSVDPHLPAVVMSKAITLIVPGRDADSTATLTLKHNPLYSYIFTSDWARELIWNEMGWIKSRAWVESKRCPDADGQSNQKVANKQVGTFTVFKSQTFQAITSVTDFDRFTTQAWKSGLEPSAYSSIEVMHNNIHNYSGTNDSVLRIQGTNRIGNMTDVQASSFDPIFWLHHVHCDRLTALWQALNPNCAIDEYPSMMDRFVAKENTKENGKSRLEPWHKTTTHDLNDYYIADDTKELTSTFEGGYCYPETPVELIQDPAKMKAYVTRQIYSLYGPAGLQPPSTEQPPMANRPAFGAPKDDLVDTPEEPVTEPPSATPAPPPPPPAGTLYWQVFLRVLNFALTGTWAVHIFLGELPESTTDWFLTENRVGSVTLLSNRSREQCANCVAQASSQILVTGTVPLNEALEKRGVDVNDDNAVSAYLKENLEWRVVKDTLNVPITPEFQLTVGVSAQTVTPAGSIEELPVWGETHVFPDITAHKTGGLSEENRTVLSV